MKISIFNPACRTGRSIIAAAAMSFVASAAYAQDVTLTISHFLSPKSKTHELFIEPWARAVEAASNGRIAIEIFPSMTLGGKPPELYRQVRDGVADIVWTLPGYTPGVFPRSEVFELPTVHRSSARATNLAIQSMSDQIADDFKDIHPILVHVHPGQAFHMVDGCFNAPKDLLGKKLRTPNRSGAWMIEAWGADAVGMPLPALPQALSKGVVDGALIPFEVVPELKINEITTCAISGEQDHRFGTAVFLFAMNKDSYNRLPDDLRQIIDDHSGANIAEQIGELWDKDEVVVEKELEQSGTIIHHLTHAETAAMNAPLAAVVDRWIAEVNEVGIDGAALVAAARKAIADNSN